MQSETCERLSFMALLEWNDKYSVNVKEIDEQHKKLIGQLNDLHAAMSAGKGKDVMSKVLKNLIDYTAYHFSTEEKYMQKYAYQDYTKHKAEHDAFVKKVLEFDAEFEAGKATVTIELIKFLNGWVSGHIKGTDKQYSQFFNEHGLK